jgi:signal recognition particle receptor subunit beta
MAVLDPRSDEVVIRIVYDGPPMAGKTTSVAVLAGRLGGQIITPDEKEGRTVFFDWLEYRGGLFEGRQIRCQIVSAPGQATLAPRRRHLIESADVVVFVCDSTPEAYESSRAYLLGLSSVLAKLNPPVGILIQANKRDHPNAAPIDDLRQLLDDLNMPVGIVESVALEGIGIRETFVFAVRLALDRVRALMHTEQLRYTKPEIDSAEDLLAELQQAESGTMTLAVDSGLTHTRLSDLLHDADTAIVSSPSPMLEQAISDDIMSPEVAGQALTAAINLSATPNTPREDISGGMIWPPVNGRLILHEIASASVDLQQLPDGDWYGKAADRWHIHSAGHAVFSELEQGRSALLQWARRHAANMPFLSSHRCLVLAEDGCNQYRLWQIVANEKSLYDQIETVLTGSADELATVLLVTIRWFLQAIELYQNINGTTGNLALTLKNVGLTNNGVNYLGLVSDPIQELPTTTYTDAMVFELLSKELEFVTPVVQNQHRAFFMALDQLNQTLHDNLSTQAWQFIKRLFNTNSKALVAIRPGDRLISILDRILFEQPQELIFRINAYGLKPLYVIPIRHSYYLDATLSMLKEIAASADLRVDTLPLPDDLDQHLQGKAKTMAILCWAAAMYGGDEKLLPWLDPESSFRLKQWPNFDGLEFQPDTLHMNLATLLFKHPMTIPQLSLETELPNAVVHTFINACALCQYLDIDGTQNTHRDREILLTPPKASIGLIARIRKSFGI